MGHVWRLTRNVVVQGVVHEAYRDVAFHAPRARVRVFCMDRWYWTQYVRTPEPGQHIAKESIVRYTKKPVTCLLCVRFDDGG
jgi:hypothetical protein